MPPSIDWPTTLGIASSIASTVLAVVAMAQSLYFYNQAKASERAAAETLAAIRAQTQTLEKIAGRQLDRLTRFATQPRQPAGDVTHVVALMRELSTLTAAAPPSPAQGTISKEVQTILNTYNVAYFSALANVGWAAFMANDKNFEEQDATAYAIIDEAQRFYYANLNQLLSLGTEDLKRAGLEEKLATLRQELEQHLVNAAQVKAAREAAE